MKMMTRMAMIIAVSLFVVQVSAQTPTASPPAAQTATQNGTIVDLVKAQPDVSTLVSAVEAAGMVETLSGDGPYTIFAPSNEAFTKLPAGKTQELMQPDAKRELNGILYNHVIQGNLDLNALTAAIEKGGGTATLKTVAGGTLKATLDNGKVVLTDEKGIKATVISAEKKAKNGVVYVIDSVLIPETK